MPYLLVQSLSLLPLLPAQAGGGEQPSLLWALAPYLLVILIFYVIWWMPVQKKQKAHQQMLEELKKGDKVVTNGGLFGKVLKVEKDVVVLELAENVRVRVSRRAIAGFEGEAEPPQQT